MSKGLVRYDDYTRNFNNTSGPSNISDHLEYVANNLQGLHSFLFYGSSTS